MSIAVGSQVEYPINSVDTGLGTVIAYNVDSGEVTVKDLEDGEIFRGFDYQLE